MPGAKKQPLTIDLKTLEQLPVAAALFDNKKVYFLNKKAIRLFKFPTGQTRKFDHINIFQLLNPDQHKKVRESNVQILNGKKLPATELDFKDFEGNGLQLEINSNLAYLDGKK